MAEKMAVLPRKRKMAHQLDSMLSQKGNLSPSKDLELIEEIPTWEKPSCPGSPSNQNAKKKRRTSQYPDGRKALETTEGAIAGGASRLPQPHGHTDLRPPSPPPLNP